MSTIWSLTLAQLRMYLRDRQSVFLSLFFPLLLMMAFGFITQNGAPHFSVAVISEAPTEAESALIDAIAASDAFTLSRLDQGAARAQLDQGTLDLALVLRGDTSSRDATVAVTALTNPDDPQRSDQALALLSGVANAAEHRIRGTEPLFAFTRDRAGEGPTRYIDFLVPGLLAFMVMQLAITGSGFNVVEYKRKGILKRLFVTPLAPFHFIASLIAMRLITILVQIGLLIAFAYFVFGVTIAGSALLLFALVLFGGVVFLALGFVLGGVAKTQNAVILFGNLFIFPQVFLASVFFPIESLPVWLQAVAQFLPLNFLAVAMREVGAQGSGVAEIWPQLVGLMVWAVFAVAAATRLFRWSDAATA